jgi:hypothetical protein
MHGAHARAIKPTSKPARVGYQSKRREAVSYYDGDPWSSHVLNEIKCGECEQEYDEQEGEGNVCPTCKEKEGESE